MRAEQRAEARRAERAMRRAARTRAWRAAGRAVRRAAPAVGAAVPVAMVNATAFVGQFAYIRDHVPWTFPGQVLVAATFESVAVYLAWHAHMAKMKNDSATRLVIGAQLFALIMGLMNYSHYAAGWRPTPLAVGLGLMSLLSPLLWGVHSKRASRDVLMAQGLVEPHAVRLGANRWTWHPVRSLQVMYHATWVGENNPGAAIGLYEDHRTARQAERAARRAKDGVPVLAQSARQGAIEAGAPAAQAAPVHQVVAQVPAGAPAGPAAPLPGTLLNGLPVRTIGAIASLNAKPTMGAQHEIDPARVSEIQQHLAGLPADSLPSERKVAEMLCRDHDHRRQAKPLIAARKAAGNDPLPAFVSRSRPVNGTSVIATPVGTMPGGASANG
jgi:hypothetical protein